MSIGAAVKTVPPQCVSVPISARDRSEAVLTSGSNCSSDGAIIIASLALAREWNRTLRPPLEGRAEQEEAPEPTEDDDDDRER